MTNILPESRRAEGIAYWGLSTIAAIAVMSLVRRLATNENSIATNTRSS